MRRFLALPLAAALALGASAALAALDTSHHDLTTYAAQTQLCYQCHGRTDTNPAGATLIDTGQVGALCLGRCHSGSGILPTSATLQPTPPEYAVFTNNTTATNTVPAEDFTSVYFSNAHGNDPAVLVDPYDGTTAVDISATGYPYVAATNIECTSCHSVHDNANSPFIWDTLGTICSNCHTGRATNNLTAAPDGNHPVDFVIDSTAAGTRTGLTRLARRISIDSAAPGRYLDVASSNGTALNGTGTAYTTGGKLDTFTNWTGAGSTQNMGCYTCHSAHQPTLNNLVNVPYWGDLPVAAQGQNALCVTCHGGGASVADNYNYAFGAGNVGMTGFGHAVNGQALNTGTALQYVTSVGGFTFVIADVTAIIQVPAGFVSGVGELGPNGEVVCSSCHDVHGATTSTKLIPQAFPTPMCNACHDGSGLPDVTDISEGGVGEGASVHHRTATANFSGNATGSNDADTLAMGNPSWAAGGFGDLSDGLQCADCHVGNGTAHNW